MSVLLRHRMKRTKNIFTLFLCYLWYFSVRQLGSTGGKNKTKNNHPSIHLDHISNCPKWVSICSSRLGELGYFNMRKYNRDESLCFVSYRRLTNMTVTVSGRDCLPPYAVIDSWHRLGSDTGPTATVRMQWKQSQRCLFFPSGNGETINICRLECWNVFCCIQTVIQIIINSSGAEKGLFDFISKTCQYLAHQKYSVNLY